MVELIIMGSVTAFFGIIVFLGWLTVKITEFCVERRYAKLRKKHPKLYEMCEERDALTKQRHKEWRARYFDPKTDIDETLKRMPYFTKEKREEEEKRLEELRKTMEDYLRKKTLLQKRLTNCKNTLKNT